MISFFFSINSHIANAQAKFSASAPKSVAENQNFNLTFSVQNGKGSGLSLPSLNDFQLLGGPSTSTSVQIINGDMSQSESYTYVLRPKKQGTFKIPGTTIN
ncbi:MAG: BatD family protein, partial [Bacteroidota bacterium]